MLKHLEAKKAMRNYKKSRSEEARLEEYKELADVLKKPLSEVVDMFEYNRYVGEPNWVLMWIHSDVLDLKDCVASKEVKDELSNIADRIQVVIETLRFREELFKK